MTPAFALAATPALTDVQQVYKTAGAAEALRRVGVLIAQHPDDATLRFQQGVMLAEQHRTAEATKVFQRLAHDFPNMPEALNNLAVLYAEQGQIDKASATLEQAMRTRPNYGTAFDNLRSTYSRMAGRAYAKALQIEETPSAPKLSLIQELYEPPAPPPLAIAAAPGAAPVAPPLTVARSTAHAPTPAQTPTPSTAAPAAVASGIAAAPRPTTTIVAAATVPPAPAVAPSTHAAVIASAPSAAPAPAPTAVVKLPASAATLPSVKPTAPPVKVAAAASATTPTTPAVVAKAPASSPTAAPALAAKTPTTTAPPTARPTDDAQQIRTAINEWAKAWARKDMTAYFAAYAPGFKSTDSSNAAWQAARRARIIGKKRISVEISGISVVIEKGVARASFRQDYAADQLRFSNQKTLQLVEHNGKWLIDKEVAGT